MTLDERFLDLASRCLDGQLSAADEREFLALLEDPARRLAFAEVDRVNQELLAALAAPLADAEMARLVLKDVSSAKESAVSGRMLAVMDRVRRSSTAPARIHKRRTQQAWTLPLGIAALLALSVAALYVVARPAPLTPVARIESLSGEVSCERNGSRVPLAPRSDLVQTDTLRVGLSGQALIVYPDGTRIRALPGAHLQFQDVDGPQVLLSAGALTADVAPQPADRPLRFLSPHALARVLGTSLRLEIHAQGTRLEVSAGLVRFTAHDRQSIDVGAGKYALAAPGARLAALEILPPAPAPAAVQPEPTWEALFTSERDWAVTHGAARIAGGILDLGSPSKAKSRVETLRSYGDFEAEFSFRLSGANLAEFQLEGYRWFFQIDLGRRAKDSWRSVKVRTRDGRREAWMDGEPLPLERGEGSGPPGGPIAFYVTYGGRLEVRDARIRELK